jgi:thiopurine S-methyltransferase
MGLLLSKVIKAKTRHLKKGSNGVIANGTNPVTMGSVAGRCGVEASFWKSKWKKGEIGFHNDDVNVVLTRHWEEMNLPTRARIFVPLCGKSQDMRWLASRGHQVVGVELSELACTQFFGDYDIAFTKERSGAFTSFESEEVRIWCGDFFKLSADDLGSAIGFWDRAALVALPPEMRRDYAHKMSRLMPVGAMGLLAAFSYPAHEKKGPPFSVSEDEVHELYGRSFDIEQVDDEDIIDSAPHFRERWGLSALRRQVYRLRRRF